MSKWMCTKTRGQSLVITALVIVALILVVGLTVDAANAYAAQRKAQSTANAAAIGGTKLLAVSRDQPGSYADVDIRAAIDAIAMENGFAPSDLIAEYLDAAGNVIGVVGAIGGGETPPPAEAAFIRVRLGSNVQTYFVRVAGFTEIPVSAATQAHNIPRGAPGCTDGIYPIAVYRQSFEVGEDYWIWDGDPNAPSFPGNFGWLRWREDNQFGSTPYLVRALTPPGTIGDPKEGYFDAGSGSHVLGIGMPMWGSSGLSNSSDVRERLDYFIRSQEPMILPLWTVAAGQGSNLIYTNADFGVFRLDEVCFHHNECPGMPPDIPNSSKVLHVTFLSYSAAGCTVAKPVDPGQGGGGQNYATAQGMVYMCSLEPVLLPPDEGSHLPVDIVHLVDSSGSMKNPLVGGGGKSKIQIEKEALVYFNNLMRPQLGDRLGAVKFQNMNPDVITLAYLTWDIPYLNNQIQTMTANGWTPWAQAVLVGTKTLYGPGRNPESKPVLIIASDGAPTVDLDNEANGDYQNLEWAEMSPGTLRYCYLKDSCSYPGCVAPAHGCPTSRKHDVKVEVLIDALDAADVVKGRKAIADTWWVIKNGGNCSSPACPYYGVTAHEDMEIFVIAIKGDEEFSSSVLQYVTSAPVSQHYFEVNTEADAQAIYLQIANAISGQLPYCYIGATQVPFGGGVDFQVIAGGAVVASGSSNPSGSYTIPEIPVDPYLFYSITGTVSYGGSNYSAASGCLNPGPVGLQVPMPQVYELPIYLVPNTNVECPEGSIRIPPP